VEEELAARLEQGGDFAKDEALFMRVLAAAATKNDSYPARFWLLLFDPALRTRIEGTYLAPVPGDEAALTYLTEVLEPAWSLRIAAMTRGRDDEAKAKMKLRENTPAVLQPAWDATAAQTGVPENVEPWRGVSHLLWGSCSGGRGDYLAELPLRVAREFAGDLTGKDLADIGSGCGPTLGAFRKAIGPDADLYATEVDPFALHILQSTHQDLTLTVLQGEEADCKLPAASVDVVIMSGVHFGSGLKEWYDTKTLPWLKTVAAALRPGGILVIDEGDMQLLDQEPVPKTEAAGFKLLALRKGAAETRAESDWIAVFQVVKG
jgi:hypothetical protein